MNQETQTENTSFVYKMKQKILSMLRKISACVRRI